MIYRSWHCAILMGVVWFAFSGLSAAPADGKRHGDSRDWKLRQLGERKIHVSLGTWAPRLVIQVAVSAQQSDKEPMRVSRLKVTAVDKEGKKLEVTSYYQDGTMLFDRKRTWFHIATFQAGTFVQNLRPDEVREVTVRGYGGKAVIRFKNGVALEEESPN